MKQALTAGEICRIFHISPETLRRYERLGLLKPSSLGERGRRCYALRQIPALKAVFTGKQLGISPEAAANCFGAGDLGGYLSLLEQQQQEIENQRERLEELERKSVQARRLLSGYQNRSGSRKEPETAKLDVVVYFPESIDESALPLLAEAEFWSVQGSADRAGQESETEARLGISFASGPQQSLAKKYFRESRRVGLHGTFPRFAFRGSPAELDAFLDELSSPSGLSKKGADIYIHHLFASKKADGGDEYLADLYLV